MMSYYIFNDLIRSLLDQRLVDSGLTLIHVGTYYLISIRFFEAE